jgi:ATP-dependent RNA circularization protein (DNA/RNA ligase family)
MDAFQPIVQSLAAGVDEKSEQVKVKPIVERVQLEAGEEFHFKFAGEMQAFLDITHGVMVSESNGPQAFVPGHLENFSRGMLSIRGGVGVNMQVNHKMILLEKGENYNSRVVSVPQSSAPKPRW